MLKWTRQWTVWAFFLLVFLVTLSGCGGGSSGDGGDVISSGGGGSGGEIATEYALSGPYTATQTSVTGFTIYYPSRMDGGHPIITWGNGTNAPTNSYWALLRQLASWGFVVIASDSEQTHSGEEMIAGAEYLIEQNQTLGSTFYGKLDPTRIGTVGHSQGGGGAINAATDPRVTCALPIAPARGDIAQVKCPIFLIAGAQDNIVPPITVRSLSYDLATAPTIFGIVQGMGHFDFLGNFGIARGYITAWFMYQLKGDTIAAQAFVGECEICNNPNWTVEKKNF